MATAPNSAALMASAFNRPCKIQLMREEAYYVPRYKHWWQGWLDIRKTAYEDDEGNVSWGINWKGPRLHYLRITETFWDSNGIDDWSWEETRFCGWDDLLRPQNRRTRLVPASEPLTVTPTVDSATGEIKFGEIHPVPGHAPITEAYVYTLDDIFLASFPFNQPHPAVGEGASIAVTARVTA